MTNEKDGIGWAWRRLVVIKALPAAVRHSHFTLFARGLVQAAGESDFRFSNKSIPALSLERKSRNLRQNRNDENMDSGGVWNPNGISFDSVSISRIFLRFKFSES
jgi:hypothetical protein